MTMTISGTMFITTLIALAFLLSSAFQSDKNYKNKVYRTIKFEISSANKNYHTDVPGVVYFMDSSLVVYLYDNTTKAIVLYDYKKINSMQYSAKVKNVSKPFIFWFYQDVLFIEHKKIRYKIYLGEEIKQ